MIYCPGLFLREARLKFCPSASAIRSIIRKDELLLPLDRYAINEADTTDIFESCSFVPLILIKYSKDIGKEQVVIH